jgi:hypothetical protein
MSIHRKEKKGKGMKDIVVKEQSRIIEEVVKKESGKEIER